MAQGIRDGLSWLLSEYDRDGSDVRVFHFSSHGTQVDDQGHDEWECFKEQFRKEHYAAVPFEKHFLLAACEDKQTAADARIEGAFRGAFTWALSKAIKEANGDLTYDELISRVGANLADYDQRPQLWCPTALRHQKVLAPAG